jgi:hypothetical protein
LEKVADGAQEGVGGARRPLIGSSQAGDGPNVIKVGDEQNHWVSPFEAAVYSLSEALMVQIDK